jgi:pimeloyl-ACP methyl ester carboxylesterase
MTTTNELLLRWASAGLSAFEAQIREADTAPLKTLFGEQEFDQMQEVANAPRLAVAGRQRPNIVFLPGIMGSLLQSVAGLVESLWVNPLVFTRGRINLLEMAEDGESDADQRVKIVATGLEMVAYAKVLLALRKQANLFLFPYDWRQDVRVSAGQLHEALNRWTVSNGHRHFTLVGHSMGGVVARTYLALFPEVAQQLVERVVMLGSPAYGVINSVQTLATGNSLTQLAEKIHPGNEGVRLARSITAIYQLLPPPPELFPAGEEYPCDFDLYDADVWQKQGIRQNGLSRSEALHRLLAAADPQMPIVQIAGYDVATAVALRGTPDALGPVVESKGPNSGDGDVPLWSARLPAAEMYYVRLPHDKLQKHRRVIQAVLDLANGEDADLPRQMGPSRGPVIAARPPIIDMDAEAERLRFAFEAGSATASDLERLFLAH